MRDRLRILLAVSWMPVLGLAGQEPPAAAGSQDPLVAKGRALFAEVNPRCTICHTVEGKGNPLSVLDGVGERVSRQEIQLWLRTPKEQAKKYGKTRKPPMLPYPEFEDAEIEALAAFIHSLPKR